MNTPSPNPATTLFLERKEGRVAYDDQGEGPLILLVPGIGDLRRQYRLLAPRLVAAGYRVVTMDLRGMGESDVSFATYNGEVIGEDILALIRALDVGPAVVVGNSIAAGSAVFAAAQAPELVSRIVMLGGFTRGPVMSSATRLLVRALMAGPWRNAVWMGLHARLFPLGRAEDHDEHRRLMRRNLAEPGRSAALAQMMLSNHDHAEARYEEVDAPSLFIMGGADSDFPDPRKEAQEVSAALGGQARMVEGAGHYPHVEAPGVVADLITDFLRVHDKTVQAKSPR